MRIIGHRGVMGEAPQNTLPSFVKALDAGLLMIELDAQITEDSQIVVFHDDDVEQIFRGQAKGAILDHTFDELRALNAHDGFEDGKTYQVPSLNEALDIVERHNSGRTQHAGVNIELKSVDTAEPVAEIIRRYLQKGWRNSDFIVSSFHYPELRKFKKLMPEIDVAILVDGGQWRQLGSADAAVKLALDMGAVAINPDYNFVTKELVGKAHQAGLRINVYTIKTSEEFRRMSSLGVDGVFVNYLGLDK